MPDLLPILTELFGYHSFRPHQEEIVRAILADRDSFTTMPTGGGKSLCYQLPARLKQGLGVVVSPLISLMKDQVDAANTYGLSAAAFNSAMDAREKNTVMGALRSGSLELLYISPERLRLADFMDFLKSLRIAFFAIDEAHCISQWGHDFRPDYLALSRLREEFPQVPQAAFTATATPRVARDIIERLRLQNPLLTRASFNRPNLFYQVSPKEKLEKQLLDFLSSRPEESGIIYRTTRKSVDDTAAFLRGKGIDALAYHAGMEDAERTLVQDAFSNDSCRVIIATVAFGMGIDKSNVRFVVHADLPKNIESYYQETGRAGRDGEAAHCLLLYGRGDIAQLMRFAQGIEDEEAREIARQQLFRMLDFTQKDGCRRKALLAYFGETYPDSRSEAAGHGRQPDSAAGQSPARPGEGGCGACDICTGLVERQDATIAAQKLLSAMVRTQERFGARHLIDIVRGKGTVRVTELGHDRLPTFGVGKDEPEEFWRRVMDALLAQGLATVADVSFPTPAVTALGWELLRGRRECSLVRVAEKNEAEPREKTRRANAAAVANPELFTQLRATRLSLARRANVPPYVIFSDRTLRELAERIPENAEEMLRIHGVGQYKLASYGESFLQVLREWKRRPGQDA
ncbi:RecQ family ATP-dependent DNA helicase [Desulfovibrio sp. OttesenSCG-928-A18]|nr:RecQ family ATP-dependent DNA helicase [Desulfovibrio sp. OttesenSCG-928-A18]